MKVVLTCEANRVSITAPAPRMMRGLTGGGFGGLPGDAVTVDLEENEKKRIEIAAEMPRQRAMDNLIRNGHDHKFAARWIDALIAGGETDATALGLIIQKTFPQGGDHVVGNSVDLPKSRWFRNAWRQRGNGIVIDLDEARSIFARRVIEAKAAELRRLEGEIVLEQMLSSSDEDEAKYEALVKLDLRKLGAAVMQAESAIALRALWPTALPEPEI